MNRLERAKTFVEREDVYKKLKGAISFLVPSRNDIEFDLRVSGSSYTDGRRVVVGLPSLFYDKSEEEMYVALRALVGHECQHINSTSFSAYKEAQERISDYFETKAGNWERGFSVYIQETAKAFLNGIEDGRIERILVSKWPGYEKYLKYLNGMMWKHTETSGDEIRDFWLSLVSVAVTGLLPKGFDRYEGQPLEKVMKALIPRIKKAIRAKTSQECFTLCEQMMHDHADYIIGLYGNGEREEEFLSFEFEQEEFEGVEGNETVDFGRDNHFQGAISENESDEGGSGGNESVVGFDEGIEEKRMMVDEVAFEEQFDVLKQEAVREAKRHMEGGGVRAKNTPEPSEQGLNEEELREIELLYRDQAVKFEEIVLPRRHLHAPVPDSWKRTAARFRKEVEMLKQNKMSRTLRGQRAGMLDLERLYQWQSKEVNLFLRKKIPFEHDYVFYLLEDGSGSMSGIKERKAKEALFMMEEGLRTWKFPFKIATFSVNDDKVIHHVVKGFEENRKGSYVVNALYERQANGANKDGFSIRVAAKELLKRPEKEKVLIVLSDGLPVEYSSEQEALDDVKKAVKEARKSGVHVIAMMFGDEEFRVSHVEKYKYMYENSIINCRPEHIPSQLSRVLRRLLSR
ncbi:UNVERIFIED_ORG: von Willebrand factor type A domain-containing protein [Anoxybacillus amylolyticus]